jgi:CHASE3 domain sensor protein
MTAPSKGVARPASLRALLVSAVAVPMLLAVAISAVFVYTVSHFIDTTERLNRADAAIAAAYETMKLLVDLETGQRGFLVGGDEIFLEPFHKARPQVAQSFDRLQTLLEPNGPAAHTLSSAGGLIDRWLANAETELRGCE